MYEDDNITNTPKRYVLTEVTNSSSYVSPTANLKLLTNVALQYPTPPPSAVQRKEKSLQILCDRYTAVAVPLLLYFIYHCNIKVISSVHSTLQISPSLSTLRQRNGGDPTGQYCSPARC